MQKIRDRLDEAKKTADKLLKEESDQITKADRLKLDYLAEEIEAAQATALKNRDLAITGMRALLALKPGDALDVQAQDLPEPPQQPALDAVLSRALDRRPEMRAADEAVKARQALVELEGARLWPDLGLVAGARLTETTNASNPQSPFVANPYHELSGYAALAVHGTFEIPQKLARRRQAEADLAEAMAMRRGAEQLVRLEVSQALGDLQEARVKVDCYTKEAAIGKQLFQAGIAFDSGLGEARELLEDTLLYARADGARLEALYNVQLAWAALEKQRAARYRGSMILALLLAVAQAGSASAAVQKAQENVRTALDSWFKSEGPARAKAKEKARAAVASLIDFDALAKSTLGKKWDELKPAERKRYTEALRGAMEANYLAKMRQGKSTDVDKVKTEVLGEEQKEGKTLVHTKVHSGEDSAAIDYVMEKGPKGWRAEDVVTEGVSLADNYREQVRKIMAKKNFDAVVTALEKKRKALEAEEDQPRPPKAG